MSTQMHAIEDASQRYAEDEGFRAFVEAIAGTCVNHGATIADAQSAFTLLAERVQHGPLHDTLEEAEARKLASDERLANFGFDIMD